VSVPSVTSHSSTKMARPRVTQAIQYIAEKSYETHKKFWGGAATMPLDHTPYKCIKLQFIPNVNGDGSKTAKIIKRQC